MKDMDFVTYILLNIEWNKDIRDSSHNVYDKRWKQGQIDLLQGMLDEMLGVKHDTLAKILLVMDEIEEAFRVK